MKTIKHNISKAARVLVLTALPLGGVGGGLLSCSDTWDDHYEGTIEGVNGGSLWQAIKADGNLSNFASVIEATGYDKSLGSTQVFTVFAPTNDSFTADEANSLIEEYKAQKRKVNDDDNTVIKEFVQNHIALYNHSVSSKSDDSIVMMNGKYAVLKNGGINSSNFTLTNKLYENGVLFIVGKPVDYSANVFEQIRKDPDLDSVRSFLYNEKFYKKVFSAGSSVEGGLDSLGRTIYLDSVFYQQNELFGYVGRIASEDSTYWMVLPTNEEWRGLVEEYSQYFVYAPTVASLLEQGDLDSLAYTNTRLAIMQGTAFSKTSNYDILSGEKTTTTKNDSVRAYPYIFDFNSRAAYWGTGFNYYQFFDPLSNGGVFYGADRIDCSNGKVFKTPNWPIDKLQTFARWIIIEGESTNFKEVDKNNKGEILASYDIVSVENNAFRNRLWSNSYREFQPSTTMPYSATYNIKGVLSNFGYDIFAVMAPALANDSNATAAQSRPTMILFTLNYPDQKGITQSLFLNSNTSEAWGVVKSDEIGLFTTTGTQVDYMLLAENFKFPVSTFGVNEGNEPSVTLTLTNFSDASDETQQQTMRLDCILLVPHGTLRLAEDPILGPIVKEYPHGTNNKWTYYRLR